MWWEKGQGLCIYGMLLHEQITMSTQVYIVIGDIQAKVCIKMLKYVTH